MAVTRSEDGATTTTPSRPSRGKDPREAQRKRREAKEAARAADAAAKAAAQAERRRQRASELERETKANRPAPAPTGRPAPKVPDPVTPPAREPRRPFGVGETEYDDAYDMLTAATRRGLYLMRRPEVGFGTDPRRGSVAYQQHLDKKYRNMSAGDLLQQLHYIRRDQRRRGDAQFNADFLNYVDDVFGDKVTDFNKRLGQALKDTDALAALAEGGDRSAVALLNAMADSPQFERLQAEYDDLYGAQLGEEGRFDRYFAVRNEISSANERYWLSQFASTVFETPTTYADLTVRYPGLTTEQIASVLDQTYNVRLRLEYARSQRVNAYEDTVRMHMDRARLAAGDAPAFADWATEVMGTDNWGDSRDTRTLIDVATRGWEARWRAQFGDPGAPPGVGPTTASMWAPVGQPSDNYLRYRLAREKFVNDLYRWVEGRPAPGVLGSAFETVIRMPQVQWGLELLSMGVGIPGGLLKTAVGDKGEITGPQMHLEALMGSKEYPQFSELAPGGSLPDLIRGTTKEWLAGGNWQEYVADELARNHGQFNIMGVFGVDVSSEARQRAADDLAAMRERANERWRNAPNPIEGFWGTLAEFAMWGSEPFSKIHGNSLNLAYNTLFDPFNKFGGSVFLRAFQLARVRSAVSAGARSTAREYLDLLGRYRLGFSTPADDPIKEWMALRPVSKVLGRPFVRAVELNGLSEADISRVAEEIFRSHASKVRPNAAGIARDLERYFGGTQMDATQIRAAAERMLDDILVERGARGLRHGELENIRRGARDAEGRWVQRASDTAEDTAYDARAARGRGLATDTRGRRLAADGSPRGRFERSPDFEDAPRRAQGTYRGLKRPGDYRAPVAHRVVDDNRRFVKYFGKGREREEGFRLYAYADPRHAEDVIAIAEDVARRHGMAVRWVRSAAETKADEPLVELYGGPVNSFVSAQRELDELLTKNRLGRTPAAKYRTRGRTAYRFHSTTDKDMEARSLAGERVGWDDPFVRVDRVAAQLPRARAGADKWAAKVAALRAQLETALEAARKGGDPTAAGKVTRELREATRRAETYERVMRQLQDEFDELTTQANFGRRNRSNLEKARLDYISSELKRDKLFLRVELNELRRQARAATGKQLARLERRIQTIEDAIVGVELAEGDQLGPVHMAKVVLQRHGAEAAQYVKGQAIAPYHESGDALRVLRGQEFHQDLTRAQVLFNDLGHFETPSGKVAIFKARMAFGTWRFDIKLDGVPPQVQQMFNGLSGWGKLEALEALAPVIGRQESRRLIDGMAKRFGELLESELGPSGVAHVPTEPKKLLALAADWGMKFEHPEMMYEGFRGLDEAVSEAVRKVRGYKAAGQLAGPMPGWLRAKLDRLPPDMLGGPKVQIPTDHDVGIQLAKIRVLDAKGVRVREYDEARGLFRRHLLRDMRGEAINAEALERAAKDGRPYRDHFLEVRDEWAAFEGRLQLRRHVLSAPPGWRPSDYWRSFVSAQQEDMLRVPSTSLPLTEFQYKSLMASLENQLGIESVANTRQLEAALRGLPMTPDITTALSGESAFRLAPIGYAPYVPAHIPVWLTDEQLFVGGRAVNGYFRENFGLVIGKNQGVRAMGVEGTLAHEYGHALFLYAAKANPALRDELVGIAERLDETLRMFRIPDRYRKEPEAWTDEALAEVYSAWQVSRLYGGAAIPRGAEGTWEWVAKNLPSSKYKDFNRLNELFAKVEPPPPEYFGVNLNVAPPFTNPAEAREWLVENGFWTPALAEDILAGRKVWAVSEEGLFYQRRYGSVPTWADPEFYRKGADGQILHERWVYEDEMRKMRYQDRGVDVAVARGTVEDPKRAVAYGDESVGVKAARHVKDMRDWAIARYGSLVSDDGVTLKAMPWLMDPTSEEYLKYVEVRARATVLGNVVDVTLVHPKQVEAFGQAVRRATEKHVARMLAEGKIDLASDFLPQEQTRLVLDIVDELLDEPSWRPWFTRPGKGPARMTLGQIGLNIVGAVQRLNVVTQVAFPILNVFETLPFVGPKRWMLRIAERGLPNGVRADILEEVPNLESLGLGQSTMLWTRRGRSSFERLRQMDSVFEAQGLGDFLGRTGEAVRHSVGALYEAPFALSALGENRLKLNFGRRLYQSRLDDYLAKGVEPSRARMLARAEVRDRLAHFFPNLDGAPLWLHALNQLIPFFSYNWNTKVLYAGELLAHPQFIRYFNILGNMLEEANRQMWEEDNPGLPFPNDRQARMFVFEVDGEEYSIDFTDFSDVTRGWKTIPFLFGGERRTAGEVLGNFIRAPHPWQNAVLQWWFGGREPWSEEPATIGSFMWPVDVLTMFNEFMADGTLSTADMIRLGTKVFAFSEPRPLDVFQSLNAAYWALPEGAARDRFLEQYPELQAHWDVTIPEPWTFRRDGPPDLTWYDLHTDAEAKALQEARVGRDQLKAYYDDALNDLLRLGYTPSDQKYRDLARERAMMLKQWRLDHPELISSEAFYMDPQEWAERLDDMATERLIDEFFAMEPPKREDYGSDEGYQDALRIFYAGREAWLEAHPTVVETFSRTQNGLEEALKAQRDHIFDVRESLFDRDRAIARASALEDRDLADALRFANEVGFMEIDRPHAVEWYPPYNFDLGGRERMTTLRGFVGSRLPLTMVLPGAKDAKYKNATDEERRKMWTNEWYANSMAEIWDRAELEKNPGAAFVEELKARPALMAEFFRRNPGKEYQYSTNDRYFEAVDKAVKSGKWNRFFLDLANDRDMALRWLFGEKLYTRKMGNDDPMAALLDQVMARVRRTGKSDALWNLVEKNRQFRETYFAGGENRQKKWAENQRYLDMMGDLIRRSKRTGDWSIFWDAIDSNRWLREKWFAGKAGRREQYEANKWYMGAMGRIMRKVNKTGDWDVFWDAIESNRRLREMWFSKKKGRREEYYENQRYVRWIGDLVKRAQRSGNWQIFWDGLDNNPAMARIYYRNHPEARRNQAQNGAYMRAMGRWVKLLDAKKYDEAQAFFNSLPAWIRRRYEQNHPQGAQDSRYAAAMKRWVAFFERDDPTGAMEYFNSLPEWIRERYYAKHPDKRESFEQGGEYIKAMGGWIALLEQRDYVAAREYFNALPSWIKERYWAKHPERRNFAEDQEMFAKLSAMFQLLPEEQGDYLEANPDLRAWMARVSGGREEVRRAMLLQVFAMLPKDAWLRRVFQERYPEVFSAEAKYERQHAKILAQLAEHPELEPGYQKYLAQIIEGYLGSVKYSANPPKPLTKVQRAAWEATRKKRLRRRREWEIPRQPSAVPGLANIESLLASQS